MNRIDITKLAVNDDLVSPGNVEQIMEHTGKGVNLVLTSKAVESIGGFNGIIRIIMGLLKDPANCSSLVEGLEKERQAGNDNKYNIAA